MSVTAVITMPMDGANGDSGAEDPHHLAGYTIEQFSSETSLASGSDSTIAHTAWSADDGWTDNGRQVQHRFDTPGAHVVTCTVTGDGGSRHTTARTVNSIAFAPTRERYVKEGGNDTDTGVDDDHAWATLERAFDDVRSLGSDASRKGVMSAIWVKRGSTITFAGLADSINGGHDPSPDHGFLVIAPYGTGAKPIINFDDGKSIACLANSHVPTEWGWSVYMKHFVCNWADRSENNGLFLGNPGSQFDGVEMSKGWVGMSGAFKIAFINGSVTLSGKDGIFASCPWLMLHNSEITLNCFLGVNAEHQVYGSNGLHHFSFRHVDVVGSDQGNDGLRFVSAQTGYVADCTVSDIFNAGDAFFPGANNSGDPSGNSHILERCVVSAANKGINANGADDVLIRNVVVKGTTGSGAVTFGGHNTGPSSVNGRIFHSVVYDSASADLTTDQYSTDSQSKNNVFLKTGGTAVFYDIDSIAEFTSDYNCFWREGGTPELEANFAKVGGVTKSWAEWKALGMDAHSVFNNPLFTNAAAGDFTLQESSPCRGNGIKLGEVPLDFVNAMRTDPPSMGAFEKNVGGDFLAESSSNAIGAAMAAVRVRRVKRVREMERTILRLFIGEK